MVHCGSTGAQERALAAPCESNGAQTRALGAVGAQGAPESSRPETLQCIKGAVGWRTRIRTRIRTISTATSPRIHHNQHSNTSTTNQPTHPHTYPPPVPTQLALRANPPPSSGGSPRPHPPKAFQPTKGLTMGFTRALCAVTLLLALQSSEGRNLLLRKSRHKASYGAPPLLLMWGPLTRDLPSQ